MRRSRASLGYRVALGAGAAYVGWRVLQRVFAPSISGLVALVTGGSRGLGLLLARELGAQGCKVVICARDAVELDNAQRDLTARGIDVLALVCDVTDQKQVEDLIEQATLHFGGIDILVNNAGIMQVGPLAAMSPQDFRDAIEADFLGAVYATLAVLPQMRARGTGRIVNITSIGGKVAVPHLLPYDAAKFALVGFSEGLSAEVRRDGILVSTVVPGLMRTGSPVNALFKGRRRREYSWFALGDGLPLTSMNAERAARRIVLAARRGESELILSWQAKALRLFHDLFPSATMALLAAANRALPEAEGGKTVASRGMELAATLPPSRLAFLMSRAAKALNQYGSESAAPFKPNGHGG
jgi:NAD(P)-dependent dehydrogenase (short-subunit alcohol dehydrogenase family)